MATYIKLPNKVRIINGATVAGPMEGQGPLAKYFDVIIPDTSIGQKSWEKAERVLMETATDNVLRKCNLKEKEIDVFVAGDLLNQIITSTFTARTLQIPFLGLYGACSTFAEGLIVASLLLQTKSINYVMAATSSHNSTSERQFRYPTEYGVQVPPTAQFTVTGSGASIVTNIAADSSIYITAVTIGNIIDNDIKSPNEMGAAMAPAAIEVIKTHLQNDEHGLESYDLILTGDLGAIGKEIVARLILKEGINLAHKYNDCGTMIYDLETQTVHSGASGCACSALVTLGYVLNEMKEKKVKKVLIVSTGALLSPTSYQQKESIPGIAHAICLEWIEKRD